MRNKMPVWAPLHTNTFIDEQHVLLCIEHTCYASSYATHSKTKQFIYINLNTFVTFIINLLCNFSSITNCFSFLHNRVKSFYSLKVKHLCMNTPVARSIQFSVYLFVEKVSVKIKQKVFILLEKFLEEEKSFYFVKERITDEFIRSFLVEVYIRLK